MLRSHLFALLVIAAPACASDAGPDMVQPPDPEVGDPGPFQPDTYFPDGSWQWANGVVKYHLSSAFKADANAMAAFNGTVAEYEALTDLTFVEQTDLTQQTIWYVVDNTAGCGGGVTTGHSPSSQPGPQVSLCTRNVATAVHETGHALGMMHEQKRPDAASFTLCHKENIDTTKECCDSSGSNCNSACVANACTNGGDFSVDTGSQRVLGRFDYLSTMMYYSTALSKNGHPTITRKDGGTCDTENGSCIDFQNGLSQGDVNSLRTMYELPLDSNQTGANYGATIAVGDFDGDGFEDVAVGAPGNTQDGKQVGAVFVYKGVWGMHDVSSSGAGSVFWGTTLVPWMKIVPSTVGIAGQDQEKFGTSLKAADLDGDGVDDLAIGAPGRNTNTGAVYVLYGRKYVQPGSTLPSTFYDGLSKDSSVSASLPNVYTRNSLGLSAGATGDNFGASLGYGAFDGGATGALAIGETGRGGGDVILLKHASTGMTLLQRVVPTTNNTGDHFGATVSAHDWDGDGAADIVVGAPQGGSVGAGKVVAFLSGGGFVQSQEWAGASGVAGDDYGTDLAYGDFKGTGTSQLAVGAPGRGGSGRVQIFDANSAGHFSFAQQIDSALAGDPDVTGDRFGSSLKSTHLHGSTHADLLVGAPRKADGSVADAGKAYTFLADSTGFTTGNAHDAEVPRAHQRFGCSVNAVDINDDGNTDGLFGASNDDPEGSGTTGGTIMTEQGSSSGLNGNKWSLWPSYKLVGPG